MKPISLTASMRSNLLSLQNISGQVSLTQNHLSTGLKVNSAIDNPSAYYSARSLTNRANDLSALLDSMGQAVQTIKSATKGLEAGAEMLSQAAAVATQALEVNKIPTKAFFEEKVGANGAVVSTAQELIDAIAEGKETICVYGKISLENETLKLKDGQKLVGTEYYTGYTGKQKFSQIDFNNTGNVSRRGIEVKSNSFISDLYLTKSDEQKGSSAIYVSGKNTTINNVDIYTFNNNDLENRGYNGIDITHYASASITGINNIFQDRTENLNKQYADFFAINVSSNSTLEIQAEMNICAKGNYSFAFSFTPHNSSVTANSTIKIKSGSIINGQATHAFVVNVAQNANFIVEDDVVINTNKKITTEQNTNISSNATFNYNPNFTIEGSFPFQQPKEKNEQQDQYNQILSQYNNLISDSSYKGINLNNGDELSVRFNEAGSANLNLSGKTMTTETLGLKTTDWSSQEGIAQSLKEIAAALGAIRSYNTELGNNYSIITTRQDFTENLINALTEGADKLTLADMNEESANMLALQTRQQLAINSLSLASQAAQGVLRLF